MPLLLAVDASPLILLSRIQQLDLLKKIARRVIVTEAVLSELEAGAAHDQTARHVRARDWLVVEAVTSVPPTVAAWDLGHGEASVLAYCLDHPGVLATIDDKAARRAAQALGIPLLGTLGVLLVAKAEGRIPRVRDLLDALRKNGIYLSDMTVQMALERAGESRRSAKGRRDRRP